MKEVDSNTFQTMPENGIAIEAVEGFALHGFQNAILMHSIRHGGNGGKSSCGTPILLDLARSDVSLRIVLDPPAEAVAAWYIPKCSSRDYTHVAEFHYLHHDKNGKPYAHLAEMGERIIAAAKTSGIKITCPVFYQTVNFGMSSAHQRRFISRSAEDISDCWKPLSGSLKIIAIPSGFSVHSLRAVSFQDIIKHSSLGRKNAISPSCCRTEKEVSDCLATAASDRCSGCWKTCP